MLECHSFPSVCRWQPNGRALKTIFNSLLRINEIGFIRHSKNYLLAEFVTRAMGFITIPIFTRLLLPEEYGILAIFASIISIFTVFMGVNFNGAVSRYYYEKNNDFASYLGSITLFLVFFNLLLILTTYFFRERLSSFFRIDSDLFLLAIVISSLNCFVFIFLSYLQASKNSRQYAAISLAQNLTIIILAIFWVYILDTNRYLGRIYAQLLITGIVFFYIGYNIILLSRFSIQWNHIRYALKFGIPLIPHVLSGFVLSMFDRVIINQIVGPSQTGLYSFAYNIGIIMNVVVMAMNKSWVPIFYEALENKALAKIQKIANYYSCVVFFAALFLIFFSREIVMLIADENYYTALSAVPIIVCGYVFVFLYTLFGNYAFYLKRTGLISINTVIAGTFNIVTNYLFIPRYGYIAAAWTTLASYALLFVLHYCNSKFLLKAPVIGILGIFRKLVIFLAAGVIYFLFSLFVENYPARLLVKLSCLAFLSFLLYRNYKKELTSQ